MFLFKKKTQIQKYMLGLKSKLEIFFNEQNRLSFFYIGKDSSLL